MKIISFMVLLLISKTVIAESYSNVSTIKGYTVGTTGVRVQLESMKVAEDCSSTTFYYLDFSTTGKEMFSTIMMATASGKKLSFQLVGCAGDKAKITHIYLCDTHFCS